MKMTELRLGNLVLNRKGKVVPLELTMLNTIAMHECEKYSRTPPYRPVPLTEDLLLKFGFEKRDGNVFENMILPYWVKNGLMLFFNDSPPENTYLVGTGFKHKNKYYAATGEWITDAHQLQNAYHAYRHQELTYNDGKDQRN